MIYKISTVNQNQDDAQDRSEVEYIDGYFVYSATLRIFGDKLDFDEISRRMGLAPTKVLRKGDQNHVKPLPYDMWQYKASVAKFRPLEEHIDVLWSAIKESKSHVLEFKKTLTVDVLLGYRTDDQTAGIVVPHTALAMFMELEIPLGLSILVT